MVVAAPAGAPAASVPVPRALTGKVVAVAGGEPVAVTASGGLVRFGSDGAVQPVAGPTQSGTDPPFTVLGAARWLAVERTFGGPLWVGPPSGPLTEIASCIGPGPALTDSALIFIAGSCDAAAGELMIVDLRGDQPAAATPVIGGVRPDPHAPDITLAGNYVGYDAGGQLTVEDWTNGNVIQTVAPEAPPASCGTGTVGLAPAPYLCSFAVGDDGSLWELVDTVNTDCGADCMSGGKYSPMPTFHDACDGRIDQVAPGAAPATIAAQACANRIVVAAGRVLYHGSDPDPLEGGDLWIRGGGVPFEHVGHPGQVLGFDGSELTYVVDACTGESVSTVALPLAGPITQSPYLADCLATVAPPVLHLGTHPRLTVLISCRIGCVGPLFAGFYDIQATRVGRSASFAFGPGISRRITIPLGRHNLLVRRARGRRRILIDFWNALLYSDPANPELGLPEPPSAVAWATVRSR